MAKFYSVGTSGQYDGLPLVPLIGTINGGIRLNSNIPMGVGAKVEFDGLHILQAPKLFFIADSIDAIFPRFSAWSNNDSVIQQMTSQTLTPSSRIPAPVGARIVMTVTENSSTANLGALFMRGTGEDPCPCISRSVRVKDETGAVVWKWLDQVSDYKSTPPNGTVVGTLDWYKDAGDGNEIRNYPTSTLAVSAINATNPTEPVTIYVLDETADYKSIPATINGQPVTISWEYCANPPVKFYSAGTSDQYDALPLMPLIGTLNGAIRLNSNISMAVGAKVEFDGLKFNELTYATTGRYLIDSLNAVVPRSLTYVPVNTQLIQDAGIGGTTTVPSQISATSSSPHVITKHTTTANLGVMFMRGNTTDLLRAISRSVRVKDSTGTVVWKWLDQVSDYKSTPPNGTVVGALDWYKDAGDGNEILNYLTPALAVSAITATNPIEPVTIYVLDGTSDYKSIPTTINGQPVTISWEYCANPPVNVYSIGTSDQFYGLPLSPEIRFDGVDGRCGFGLIQNGLSFSTRIKPMSATGTKYLIYAITGNTGVAVSYNPTSRLLTAVVGYGSGVLYRSTTQQLVLDQYNDVSLVIAGRQVTITVNGVSNSSTAPADIVYANLPATLCGRASDNVVNLPSRISELSINSYTYIQQGDQSSTNILPSHPSGANGTLVGGASWQYSSIEANYLTPALAVSAITATNPTEPVTIYILDRSTDVSGIPATINGQPVTLDYTYCVTCDASFGFGFGFNF